VRRREFIGLLGGTIAAWPLAARAQQPAMPVIGFLSSLSLPGAPRPVAAFRQGLNEAGFVVGQNVAIEYRYAEGQYDRLPAMASDFARRQVAVIVANTTPAALAAKSATATLPIVFTVSEDPVELGLVASLPRPGGNATGVSFLLSELGAKQLGLLHELVPSTTHFGLLVNPGNENAESITRAMKVAASVIGAEITVVEATDSREIEAAFATLVRSKAGALVVGTDPFFYTRRVQLVTLAARHALPTAFNVREYAEAGGLLSYGTNLAEAFRLAGARESARIGPSQKGTGLFPE
jgi:putative tryptophan/tyrosine transport system substrate-binding protein